MRPKELLLAVYLPTALLALAQGLLLATLPIYATELGLGGTMVGVIVAAAAMGTLVTDVPAGALLHRIGLRRAMLIGASLVVIGTITLFFELPTSAMIALRVLAGVGTAMWGLSRHTFIAQAIPPENRGKSIAMFGGINRAGIFGGPAIGGAIATAFGTNFSFLVAGGLGLIALIVAARFIPNDREQVVQRRGGTSERWAIVRATLRQHASALFAAGVAQLFAQMIRQGRQLLIPLFGVSIGLNPAEVGLVMSISAIIDMSMFFPAGVLMDRFGRKFAAVPSFAIMALGVGMMPLANSMSGLMVAGVVIGLGNGLGSGTMMTLGADMAPEGATGEFLGIWRLIGDFGMVVGPLAVGVLAESFSLTTSAYMLTAAGLVSSLTLLFLVKETRVQTPVTQHASHTTG